MSLLARWQQSFSRSPVTWILAAMLAVSVYSHWRTGQQFSQVCQTVLQLSEGYFDLEQADKMLATGIDTDAIMAHVDRITALRQADSLEGRAYRWWEAKVSDIIDDCSDRLAEPEAD